MTYRSKIVVDHGDEELVRRALRTLHCWTATVRQRRRPIRHRAVLECTDTALMSIDPGGVQLTRHRIGDWDAEIEAVDEAGTVASLRFGYNGAGVLRDFRPMGTGEARARIDEVSGLL